MIGTGTSRALLAAVGCLLLASCGAAKTSTAPLARTPLRLLPRQSPPERTPLLLLPRQPLLPPPSLCRLAPAA